MSFTITKAGILDTVQDTGRYGFQSFGINPGGAMDRFSAKLSNCFLGKEMDEPVIELHFPASTIRFNKALIICITGADFSPVIDDKSIPINQPVIVNKGTLLGFSKATSGARCYLSISQNLHIKKWLGSFSTNLKAEAGGFKGRAFKAGDIIDFEEDNTLNQLLSGKNCKVLPWRAEPLQETATDAIEFIEGPEWNWLTAESQKAFTNNSFVISNLADRMGYRLEGSELKAREQKQLVSSGVSFGTVQLLPNGQLIVLMADHQTTGGYPRIANVISAHLRVLAQMKTNEKITFRATEINTAEQKLLHQHQYLRLVQYASQYKMQNLLQ